MNGGFLGQVDGAGLLEDVPDAFDAVALQILGVLRGTRETERATEKERDNRRRGERAHKN